ncbi:MAG: hypothetical protein C0596_01960 [Marinilabiliales bacterium]|nr:MAG: hypothetical protein C0596_01960 [Marinilabiliales bacterium]
MKKIFFIVLIVLPIITIRLQAQTNYYWSNGEKQGLNIINTKKFVLVDSTITDSSSLVTALNDTSLTVNDFTTFFLPSHFPLDSVDVYKTCAIIESNDSICVDSLLANTHIKYVSGYYSVNDAEVGTSHLFYVKLTHTQDTTLLDSLSNIQKTKVLGTFDSENKWFIVECTNDSNSDALTMSNTFYETGIFEYSHPSFIGNFKPDAIESRSVSCANDELFHEQWGLNNVTDNTNIDVSACEAWRCTKGDTNIIIAILDSGVKLDHPDLSTIDPYISYDIMSGSTPSQLYQNLSPKLYSHGTNAAGIIGAQHNSIGVAGIAPDCAIMSLSLDWDIPHEFGDPIAPIDICLYDGISYAWQNGADIISNSWSGATNEDIILDAINQATTYGRNEYGCIIVNSTGNGDLNEVLFPSNLSNVIGVGAIDSCGIRGIRPSIPGDEDNLTCGSHWPFGGSNYGFGLSVVAPGSDVTTTTIVNDQGISTEYKSGFNGTSAAAPYISGVAALILSINPDLTYEEVKDIIEQSAQKIREDFYSYNVNNPNGTWNYKLGYGMVNAYDALQLVCADMCNVTTYVSSLQNVTW